MPANVHLASGKSIPVQEDLETVEELLREQEWITLTILGHNPPTGRILVQVRNVNYVQEA